MLTGILNVRTRSKWLKRICCVRQRSIWMHHHTSWKCRSVCLINLPTQTVQFRLHIRQSAHVTDAGIVFPVGNCVYYCIVFSHIVNACLSEEINGPVVSPWWNKQLCGVGHDLTAIFAQWLWLWFFLVLSWSFCTLVHVMLLTFCQLLSSLETKYTFGHHLFSCIWLCWPMGTMFNSLTCVFPCIV